MAKLAAIYGSVSSLGPKFGVKCDTIHRWLCYLNGTHKYTFGLFRLPVIMSKTIFHHKNANNKVTNYWQIQKLGDNRSVAKGGYGGSRDPQAMLLTHFFGYTVGLTFQSPKSVIHKAVYKHCVTCNFKLSYLIVMIVFTEHRAISSTVTLCLIYVTYLVLSFPIYLKTISLFSCLSQFHDSVLSSLLRMPFTVCLIRQCVK